jgi:hypothetical protein
MLAEFRRSCHAQTPFERLFDPRQSLHIILEISPADWTTLSQQVPASGVCAWQWNPANDRYTWRTHNITIATEWAMSSTQQTYVNAGVKKKGWCGSYDNTKPSLTINLSKYQNNDAQAENHIGTTHLSLENSRQDPALFKQCAAYHAFRSMGLPAPMCSFAALYRRDGTNPPLFVGLYVLTEAVKKDFFRRRPLLENVPNGSLYELEVPDEFNTSTLQNELQVEWSSSSNQDFAFAVNQFQSSPPATALANTLDLPSFIDYWATEIFLKHWDGFTGSRNNTYVFEDAPPMPIQKTRFHFIPHGADQILDVNTKPSIYKTAAAAQLAFQNNGLRYQLVDALSLMGGRMAAADIPSHVNSFVPLVIRLWRGTDPFFGADPNAATNMAERVRLALEQAIVDIRTVFGNGVHTQPFTTTRIIGPSHNQCVTRVSASNELRHEWCIGLPGQQWTFESMPQSMGTLGFAQMLKLYRIRNQGTNECITSSTLLPSTSDRYKLITSPCSLVSAQRFFVNRREGLGMDIRSFERDACVHFSDGVLTNDGRSAVYASPCTGEAKNVMLAE